MKWSENLPLPARYAAGAAILLSYVVLEAIAFARLPRSERERLLDMLFEALDPDEEPKRKRHGA